MKRKYEEILQELIKEGVDSIEIAKIQWEMELDCEHTIEKLDKYNNKLGLYESFDFNFLQNTKPNIPNPKMDIQTLNDLIERDKQREEDGLPRRIRLGKIVKTGPKGSSQVVIVPTTVETKFYHDNSITEDDEQQMGGAGGEAEGDVIGEQKADQEGQGDGAGPGQGGGENHDLSSDAYHLGKILTEKFELPDLKDKGSKKSLSKYKYDLTDVNKGFGQILDKKQTLKNIIKSNIVLGNITPGEEIDATKIIITPDDKYYKILSKERDYETEATVFFVRDYSGSMQGAPSEAVLTQHLFIYSWLVYQYDYRVTTKFILHDTEAKEVDDFDTYYKSTVAGGTQIFPAFELVNQIIENEKLALKSNVYVFYGSDGDDWNDKENKLTKELRKLAQYANRIGLFVTRNSYGGTTSQTTLEKSIESSNLLIELRDKIKMDVIDANDISEKQIIETIKKLLVQ